MHLYRRILVPRDFSPTSERALECAIDLAGRTGAELHLLHAEVLHGDPVASRAAEKKALSVEAITERLNGRTGSVKAHSERDIAAAPAIVRFAEDNDVDLIVMGTHGRRGVRRFLVGSVTEEVVRTGPCDVLTLRETAPPLAGRPILVPVDFSDHSRRALARARQVAASIDAPIIIMHSAHVVPYPAFYGTEVPSASSFPGGFEDDAEQALREFASEAAGSDGTHPEVVLRVGEAYKEIADYAGSKGVGLIVMGRRGLSGLEKALLGSTTERTLRIAPCAVLVSRMPAES